MIFLEIDRKISPAARNRGQGLVGKSEELAELQNIPQYRAQERAGDHPRTGRGPVRKNFFFVIFLVPESGWVLARERPGTGRKKRGICRAAVYSTVQIRGESRGPSEVRPGTVPETSFSPNFLSTGVRLGSGRRGKRARVHAAGYGPRSGRAPVRIWLGSGYGQTPVVLREP